MKSKFSQHHNTNILTTRWSMKPIILIISAVLMVTSLAVSQVAITIYNQNLAVVRFKNYRKVDSGWYPYEIDYSVGNERTDRYSVLDLQVNTPIETSFFEGRGEKTGISPKRQDNGDAQEERLREVIKVLKDKYGD